MNDLKNNDLIQDSDTSSVFNNLIEDAKRRQNDLALKESILNQHEQSQLVSDNSNKILAKRLLSEFEDSIINIQKIYPDLDLLQNDMSEEQFVALLYTLGIFKDIGNEEEKLYSELLRLISIIDEQNKLKPVFSIRNAKALLLGVYNIFLPWMCEQDSQENDGSYHSRIQKFKLICDKLHAPISDALKHSFLGTPLNELNPHEYDLLTDQEKDQLQENITLAQIGHFKGKSLCLTQQDVNRIHKNFYKLYQNKSNRDFEHKQIQRQKDDSHLEETFKPKINEHSNELALRNQRRLIHRILETEKEDSQSSSQELHLNIRNTTEDDEKIQAKFHSHYKDEKEDSLNNGQILKRIQQKVNKDIRYQKIQNNQSTVDNGLQHDGAIEITPQNNNEQRKPINYTRINQLYHMGRTKIVKGHNKEQERRKQLEEIELQQCTFSPKLNTTKKHNALSKASHMRRVSDINSNTQNRVILQNQQSRYINSHNQENQLSSQDICKNLQYSDSKIINIDTCQMNLNNTQNSQNQSSSKENQQNQGLTDKSGYSSRHKKNSYSMINNMKKQKLNQTQSNLSINRQDEQVDNQQLQSSHKYLLKSPINNYSSNNSSRLGIFDTNRYFENSTSRKNSQNKLQQVSQNTQRKLEGGSAQQQNYSSYKNTMRDLQNDSLKEESTAKAQQIDDEVQVVEIILGNNLKKQIQITRGQDIDYVAFKFCLQNDLELEQRAQVSQVLRQILGNYNNNQH
eukprot:403363509